MKQLVAFFETDPQVIAKQTFIQRVVLQTLFTNKNLYRYHRDFEHRWRLIYEQTLVSDLAYLPQATDFSEREFYQILKKNKVQDTEPTAQGLQKFLDGLNYLLFSDMGFCNLLIKQVEQYPELEQEQLYSLLQTFLFYLASSYKKGDARLRRQWQSLNSFFVGAQGEMTPFFRAVSAHLLYTMPARTRSSSGGHLKGPSVTKLKNIPNNIVGLPSKLDYERLFVLKTIKNIERYYQQGVAAHHSIAQPLINYFEEHYNVRVEVHSKTFPILIGLFPQNQSSSFWISAHECSPENAAKLYEKFLDLYLDEIINGNILDVFKVNPHTPEHHLSSISEASESDFDNEDAFDSETDFSGSLSSDSGRMRGSFLNGHWSHFGKKWRHKKDSEKLPYLVKGLSKHYGWPEEFLTVVFSSLNPETIVITERDYYLLTKEERDFQCQAFVALQQKWDRNSIEVLSQPYHLRQVVFPFIQQKASHSPLTETIVQQINHHNICFSPQSQRYKYIDTPCLEALIQEVDWDESLDRELVAEAFHRSSSVVLERVLAKNRPLVAPWADILKIGLFEQNWSLVEMLIKSPNTTLSKEDWLLLVSWAVVRKVSCRLQEVALYTVIEREFQSLMSQDASTDYWYENLCNAAELFEKRVAFCSLWGYPEQPRAKTFLEGLNLYQKILRYECWRATLSSNDTFFDAFCELILAKETDMISKEVARLCLRQIHTPEELLEQFRLIALMLRGEDEDLIYQLYELMMKIYLAHYPEQHGEMIKLLCSSARMVFLPESGLQQLQRIFPPASIEQLNAEYEKTQQNKMNRLQVLIFTQELPLTDLSIKKRSERLTL